MKTISKERLEKEFDRTEKALKAIRISSDKQEAHELFDLASRYYDDAKYFRDKGDWASAFGALNYSFGLLDAGAKMKIFEIISNKELFIVD
jgi:hypothetical protein